MLERKHARLDKIGACGEPGDSRVWSYASGGAHDAVEEEAEANLACGKRIHCERVTIFACRTEHQLKVWEGQSLSNSWYEEGNYNQRDQIYVHSVKHKPASQKFSA